MMTCDDAGRWLDDLVDGDLGEALASEVRAHLDACAACRAEECRRRELVLEAASLPREIQPSGDLWAGIAARLSEPVGIVEARPVRRWTVWSGMAAAAVLLVAGTALVTAHLVRSRPRAVTARASSPAAIVPAAITSELNAPQVDLERAAGALRAALESRRGQLSPATLKVVDENLAIIDAAIDRLQAALREDPGNRALVTLLTATWERKIDLLQTASELARTS
ncbi:MAG: zf-HC2 domain-containing protein [Thermoanaerobaculaceae bacterium]|jgi:anti-sigma factor RsiW|nr:zf-HC2 domain-containing protein [Thermoanaerobaculaceae bacterium]